MPHRTSRRLARQAIETSLAAPVVVAHRVARMAAARSPLSARDRTEFTRMGMEKVWAFNQSWAAMWTQMLANQFALMQSVMMTAAAPVAGRRPSATAAQAAWNRAAHRMLSAGLEPVHKTAVANARRLSRRRG